MDCTNAYSNATMPPRILAPTLASNARSAAYRTAGAGKAVEVENTFHVSELRVVVCLMRHCQSMRVFKILVLRLNMYYVGPQNAYKRLATNCQESMYLVELSDRGFRSCHPHHDHERRTIASDHAVGTIFEREGVLFIRGNDRYACDEVDSIRFRHARWVSLAR